MNWLPAIPRMGLYATVNAVFIAAVFALAAVGGFVNPRILHLILLFAVCSTPIIDLDRLNGKLFMPSLYLAFYFVSFGLLDFVNLAKGISSEMSPSLYSETEAAILAGAIMVLIGYRSMFALAKRNPSSSPARDWPMRMVLILGVTLWVTCTGALYVLDVYIIPNSSPEASKKGLEIMGPYGTTAFMLAGMMQPFGILLIAYAWRSMRSHYLLWLVILTVFVQVLLGFIVNIRGLSMIGGILAIITIMLVDGRVPIWWLVGAVLYAQLVFPIFVGARAGVHGNGQIARSSILENLGHVLELSIAAESRLNQGSSHSQSVLERASVRNSMQMIVERTGVDVPFQHGRTLKPLLATFIPRIIWPDKPDIATGQVVNKEFHVTDVDFSDTYISPSIPGELYWNFGWPGFLVGMALIGGILGYLGQRFNLAERKTVTGLLVLVITTKEIIVGLEGTFSPNYVVWMRSMGAAGILHLLFARVPVFARAATGVDVTRAHEPQAAAQLRPFPHLLS